MRLPLLIMAIATVSAMFIPGSSNAQIETLVMPGAVIEGHAEYEPECASCHKKFDRPGQRQLCMDCHEDVGADIGAKQGFHGLFPDAQEAQCYTCHTDHRGRDADIIGLRESTFDHAFTDFELIGSHLEVACADCHAPDTLHREASGTCNDCHSEDDAHKETLGTDCAECHRSTEWKDVTFDHDATDYPLLGKHIETACLDCHEDATYLNAPTTCYGCHAEDDAHDGRSGQQCETCHNPSDWNDSSFDHVRDTEFALEGKHAELACDDCHSEDPFQDKKDSACIACHLEDDDHEKHNGDKCETCHSSSDWAESKFDHDVDTDYEIHGAHASIECESCHVKPIYDVELHSDCHSCHEDDDSHKGTQGVQCDDCHNDSSWEDDVLFDHDLTGFPLLGNHAGEECDACHESHVFTDAPTDCAACHSEDDKHEGRFHENCARCHNPVDWVESQFDHDVQTNFLLEGAHGDVACDACHRGPLEKMTAIDGSCRSCHRADDIHDGEFGSNCGRCHTADSFREVRSLQ